MKNSGFFPVLSSTVCFNLTLLGIILGAPVVMSFKLGHCSPPSWRTGDAFFGTWALGKIRRLVFNLPRSQVKSLTVRHPFQVGDSPWRSTQNVEGPSERQQLPNNLGWRDLKTLVQGVIGKEGSDPFLLLSFECGAVWEIGCRQPRKDVPRNVSQWPQRHVASLRSYLQLRAQAPTGFEQPGKLNTYLASL